MSAETVANLKRKLAVLIDAGKLAYEKMLQTDEGIVYEAIAEVRQRCLTELVEAEKNIHFDQEETA